MTLAPVIATSWVRAFHVLVLTPSFVRFAVGVIGQGLAPKVSHWLAASSVAESMAWGSSVRAHVSPTPVRFPAAS